MQKTLGKPPSRFYRKGAEDAEEGKIVVRPGMAENIPT